MAINVIETIAIVIHSDTDCSSVINQTANLFISGNTSHIQGGQKIGTIFVRLNFTKCQPIIQKIISLSESGENV